MLCQIACLGRHTVTGLLSTAGCQYSDWSADYRLYSEERFSESALFDQVRQEVEGTLEKDEPLVVAMDESLLRKTGRKVYGTSYRRDPLGPKFQVNFAWGQRVLQLSAALPLKSGAARMIPIDFIHSPLPKKPKKKASQSEWERYEREYKEANISKQGVKRIAMLRSSMDASSNRNRKLQLVVDGGFTNGNVLKNLPHDTTLIGRVRKDAKLYHLPDKTQRMGRRRVYGNQAPTPEMFRKDESVPYQKVEGFACGKTHMFKIKTLSPLRWRAAGGKMDFKLVVIAPLAYRLNKNSRVLYRKPAYLLCSDPNMPIEKILQSYLWRWDIEVNFRDQKHILGVGQAQVRTKTSCQKVPALAVAAYSVLLTAAAKLYPDKSLPALPLPKWRKAGKQIRASTQSLVNLIRFELWAPALKNPTFSDFASSTPQNTKSVNLSESLDSALFSTVT